MSDTAEATSTHTTAPPVHLALLDVMDEVQAVGKTGFNGHDKYNFRGIDAVINAVGPAFRKHRILPVPKVNQVNYRDVQTYTGKPSREVTVRVTYRFIGPAGDSIEIEDIPGEAMDRGDKGTAKAMSVAYRIALLQLLCIPTDEPDPDQTSHERAENATVKPSPEADQLMQRVTAMQDLGDLLPTRDAISEAVTKNIINAAETAILKREFVKRRTSIESSEASRTIRAGEIIKKAENATTYGEISAMIDHARMVNLLEVQVDDKRLGEHLASLRDQFQKRADCGCTTEEAAFHGKQCSRQMTEAHGPSWDDDTWNNQ